MDCGAGRKSWHLVSDVCGHRCVGGARSIQLHQSACCPDTSISQPPTTMTCHVAQTAAVEEVPPLQLTLQRPTCRVPTGPHGHIPHNAPHSRCGRPQLVFVGGPVLRASRLLWRAQRPLGRLPCPTPGPPALTKLLLAGDSAASTAATPLPNQLRTLTSPNPFPRSTSWCQAEDPLPISYSTCASRVRYTAFVLKR